MGQIKTIEWLNSGEYQADIDTLRTKIMIGSKNAKNEANIASVFETELYYLIRSKTGIELDFVQEVKIDNVRHNFGILANRKSGRGRIDAVVNNLVIEYKHYSKLETKVQKQTAIHQVIDYLLALYTKDKIKYSAILTDGLKICYFQFVGDDIKCSSIRPIQIFDINNIVQAIISNNKKKFVARNILKDFSISPEINSITKSLADKLYNNLKYNPTEKTNMLYQEWQSLMHLSVEDNGRGNDIDKRRKDLSLIFEDDINSSNSEYIALYALQTTYAIIVKLIACKVIDKLEYNTNTNSYSDLTNISSNELQIFLEKMEDGYSYKNNNIKNFLEGDFFSWYSDKKQWSSDLWKLIKKIIYAIDEYSAFNFNFKYEPIDIFKDLYMSIIPKSIRHSMGEYFTPYWLSDYVVTESIKLIKEKNKWKAIDPCCGSGIFIISLIKHIVGNVDINLLSTEEKNNLKTEILNRVYGIDINPLSVLSARVGYYLALMPFGNIKDIEIPIYLGDSAIIPTKIKIDNIDCYKYSVVNEKCPFDVILPKRLVKQKDFSNIMNEMQSCVKTDDSKILCTVLKSKLSKEELTSPDLVEAIEKFASKLTVLHKNSWDGIWIRIATNFMLIARLESFDLIVGNPPWVKWEHLPSVYANKIKELCNIKHIFSTDGGLYGGTQLNICALISNVTASNWLKRNGVLAFLMPDSIMSQNSYSEYRNFYTDYEKGNRLYFQQIDKWQKPLRPFRYDNKAVTQDFITYYISASKTDYKQGIPVKIISRDNNISDDFLNQFDSFNNVKQYLNFDNGIAAQVSKNSTAFSYLSSQYDYSRIVGKTAYKYRTGVEFTPQELYILESKDKSQKHNFHKFTNKKFSAAKYLVEDIPKDGWEFSTDFIYPIVRGPNLKPFKYNYSDEYCILPYNSLNTKTPVDSDTLYNTSKNLFMYLLNHKDLIDKQSTKSQDMHRGEQFYALSKVGPYTFADNIVAARDNTSFCAAVIESTKTAWGQIKQTICVKHTIIISQDIYGNFITADEANYISGILNSSIVINYMHDSFKTNGFSLNKSNLCIPKFDKNNRLQNEIATLAKIAKNSNEDQIEAIQTKISNLYIQLCDQNKEL